MAIAVLTAGCAAAQKSKPAPAPPAAPAAQDTNKDQEDFQDFVLGAEDVITITVYDLRQFDVVKQQIRPDGFIAMPLVGEVKAAGKHPRDLEAEISKILADKYVRTVPRVTVRVDEVNSRYFSINGGVLKPGRFPLLVPTTIMQALVNAGGFKEFANTKSINLLRDSKVFVTFNFNDALKGKHPEKNVQLKHGDIIVVKE